MRLISSLGFFFYLQNMALVYAFPGLDHPYVDPTSVGAKRSPCPALNTLANYGFLTHSGIDVPTKDIIKYTGEVFGVTGVDAIIAGIPHVTRYLDDGTQVLDFEDLVVLDVDSSLAHQDLYFNPKASPNATLLDGVEAAAGEDGILTHEELADWRDVRLKDSLENNPFSKYGKQDVGIIGFNSAMLFIAFGSDPTLSTVSIEDVMTFLRDNRFPVDFVPRAELGEKPRNWLIDPLLQSVQNFFSRRAALKLPMSASKEQPPGMVDCVNAFTALQFEITDYDKYDIWFRQDSKVILSEAGVYMGPDGIEEYVRFADEDSPYIKEQETLINIPLFKEVDPRTGTCKFLTYGIARREMDESIVPEATYLLGILFQVTYKYHEQYISQIDVYYEPEYLDFYFGTLLNNDNVRNMICDVSEDSCPNTNVGMSRGECVQKLKELPTFTNGSFDGKDYGCRALHAVFASHNQNHCAHISFEPQEDLGGNVVCQTSKGLNPLDLFDEADLEDFRDFLESPESLIESKSGFKILSMPKPANKRRLVIFGFIMPCMIFFSAVIFMKKNKTGENDMPTAVHALLANKAKQAWIMGVVMLSILVFVNGLSCLVVWRVSENHEDWDDYPSRDNELEDKYRGKPTRVGQTVPHHQMDDEYFGVYTGFVVWGTCLLAGLGLEVFVWHHFLRVWCEGREGLWRFVQFIFPLMLVTALGLSLHQSFLALPVLVLGLWKFGFPETLMYMYLGLFSQSSSRIHRVTDFLNGAGTLLHHGAASMIVSMLVVGVIPPSRYVLNSTLILGVQHWVVLLAYADSGLYTGIELVLEYFFEWIVLSDFAELYHLHWTAAVGAGVMLFAHWLYVTAAALQLLTGSSDPGHKHNVHTRGNRVILKPKPEKEESDDSVTSVESPDDQGLSNNHDGEIPSNAASITTPASQNQSEARSRPMSLADPEGQRHSARHLGSRLSQGSTREIASTSRRLLEPAGSSVRYDSASIRLANIFVEDQMWELSTLGGMTDEYESFVPPLPNTYA